MERVILYVDDATHALAQLEQLRASGLQPTHWVLAACAPRMTSRISKWVSHSARENWRVKWFARLQETLAPALQADGAHFTAVLAQGQLLALTQQLLLAHGAARVIDLRRPKVGAVLEPVQSNRPDAAAPRAAGRNGALSGGTLGIGALMVLTHTLGE